MPRKIPLANGEIYHLYTRSIASYVIFSHPNEFSRLVALLDYYRTSEQRLSFSRHVANLKIQNPESDHSPAKIPANTGTFPVRMIAYCIMPTHIHLLLQQTAEDGITTYMHRTLTGFSKFFNLLHKRKGPLWESRFQSRHVASDEYLFHLTRYIHLNPVKAGLVQLAEDWISSSYREYIGLTQTPALCEFKGLIPYSPIQYKKLTEDHADYQKSLGLISRLLLDSETHP